jgi:3-hydroxyacyl-CoA dehydrogenase
MSDVDILELSQEEEMELVTQVKKLEDTNNLSSSSLDDLAISQIAENMENEHFVFQKMEDLCVTRNSI